MKYRYRQWWFKPRHVVVRWHLFQGCPNFGRHYTWRFS